MRIIAGKHKGRRLTSPKDNTIRPTTSRTREAMFNLLMHGELAGASIIGQPVADLCCGTGALGLEALSRGASHCTFLDSSKNSLALAQSNAAHIGATDACAFLRTSLPQLPAVPAPVALILMDAPYASGILRPTLTALHEQRWLKPGATLALEHAKHVLDITDLPYTLHTERTYGTSRITVLRYA